MLPEEHMTEVTIKLITPNFSVEVTGEAEYAEKKAEELAEKYLAYGRKAPNEQTPATGAEDRRGKKISAAEFLRNTGHKNQTDRGLVLGFYLERMSNQQNFTTSEVGELGIQTKQPFTNISDTVSRLVSRGLMMSSGEKDGQRAYALTATGEEYVKSMTAAKQ
jgi:hypothetical protein